MPINLGPYPTDQFVFFGDSTSDNGNLLAASEGVIDETLYQQLLARGGQISNGPVFAEFIANNLGLNPSLNYAVAGAEADGTQRLGDFLSEFDPDGNLLVVPQSDPRLDFDMNLNAQIDRFASDAVGETLSNRTAFVLIGGNDYLELSTVALDPFDFVAEFVNTLVNTVEATIAAAQRLGDLGFGEVVVSSLPSAAFYPIFSDLPDLAKSVLEAAIDTHNEGLKTGVSLLQGGSYSSVYLDTEAMADAIANDPTAFGFIAPLDFTLSEASTQQLSLIDEDQIAFFDDIHPSTATHAMLGAYTAWALQGQVDVLSGASDIFVASDDGRLILTFDGQDSITGGAGHDFIFLGTGDDESAGADGDDLILAGSGNDNVIGDGGNDLLVGGIGDDTVNGAAGNDVLFDGLGSDINSGGTGDDIFIFFDNRLIGGTTANGDTDLFDGGDGTDALVVVLSEDTAQLIANAEISDPQQILEAFDITTTSIEQVEFLVGLDALDVFSEFDWYDTADVWGML